MQSLINWAQLKNYPFHDSFHPNKEQVTLNMHSKSQCKRISFSHIIGK